jgi:tRNA modification GTPase
MNETIFALSTGQGRAGVAIIRVSGPESDVVLHAFTGRLPKPRQATLMTVKDPLSRERLDQCLVLRFLENASFTGEPSFELHVHGGRAVIQSVLASLTLQKGLRLAEAGEFTKRALENGKLDLTQVESLADLIDADTEMQRRQALRGLEGVLGVGVKRWRDKIIEIKSLIAAEIDFSDEGDVGESPAINIDSHLERLENEFQVALASRKHGRIISEGFRIAIVGEPNVGKSTLLNRLAASDIAIVTEHAGTTRDVLEVRLDIEGYPVVLFDTAGLRETQDPVECIGIERAREAAGNADLLLILSEVGEFDLISKELDLMRSDGATSIRIRTKQDKQSGQEPKNIISISAKTGFGLAELKQAILHRIKSIALATEPFVITRERQRLSIENALRHCQNARRASNTGIEFLDEDIRQVDLALAKLLGFVGVEEVLGAIFSRFCVGK